MSEPQGARAPIAIVDDPANNRYEATLDGAVAVAEYVRRGSVIVFTHTEVPDAIEGRGVADALARRALDDARAAGVKVVPRCPFFDVFMRRHREYDDLRYRGTESE
jgi:uncharacterized protein